MTIGRGSNLLIGVLMAEETYGLLKCQLTRKQFANYSASGRCIRVQQLFINKLCWQRSIKTMLLLII